MSIQPEQAQAIADRLAKIYKRAMQLRAEASTASPSTGPLPIIWFDDIRPELRSRLDSVDDVASGLDYAVWLIGETLAITGGDTAMHAVYDRFEAMLDARASSWLDHRWSGASAPGALWVA